MSADKVAFQDAMEGSYGILVQILSRPVMVQPDVRAGNYYRFGAGNPIVRLDRVEGDWPWQKRYVFVVEDRGEVVYTAEEIVARLGRNGLEEIRPVVWPVTKMHETLSDIVAYAAYCLAGTLEGETMLARPDRKRIAADVKHAEALLAALRTTPDGRAGVKALEGTIQATILHTGETIRAYETKRRGGISKIQRHRAILASLESARAGLRVPGRRIDPSDAVHRLDEALKRANVPG